ncbi:MAG: hypothetical protein AAF465_10920 [Pseudomonadota bacterium]
MTPPDPADGALSAMTQRFMNGELDPVTFDHRAHLRVAFDVVRTQSFIEALRCYLAGIDVLVNRAGVPEKRNVTITIAFLSLVAERVQRFLCLGHSETSDECVFEAFLAANPDLEAGNALRTWYSQERLNSDFARTHFALPDRVNV